MRRRLLARGPVALNAHVRSRTPPKSRDTHMTSTLLTAVLALLSSADTLRVEVGSGQVNGRIYAPHAARVNVSVGERMVAQWTTSSRMAIPRGGRCTAG